MITKHIYKPQFGCSMSFTIATSHADFTIFVVALTVALSHNFFVLLFIFSVNKFSFNNVNMNRE